MHKFKQILVSLVTFYILLQSFIAYADAPSGYHFVDFDSGFKQAQSTGKPIFIYYGRYGCGFCDKTNKESFSDVEVSRIYNEHYALVYIDAESGKRLRMPSGEIITEQQFGARLGVLGSPYFMMMDSKGDIHARLPGYKTAQDFIDLHQYMNGRHFETVSFVNFSKE